MHVRGDAGRQRAGAGGEGERKVALLHLAEWVWDPSRISPTFWIDAAFGVAIWNDAPWLTVPGACVTSGRGASSPEPSFLNR